MAFEARSFDEAVLEETGEQGFVSGECDDTVADVSRREHVELLAQTPAGAAIIAHRNDGAQFTDFRMVRSAQRTGSSDVTLQPFEQCGQASAAADGDHAQTAV